MATRIQWSATERAEIAHQIREIRSKGHGRHDLKDLLRTAQLVLPPERRRKITDSTVFTLKKWLNDIIHEPVLDPIPEVKPEPLPEQTAIPEPPGRSMKLGYLALELVREITREVMREMRAEREREEAEGERERYRDLSDRVSAVIARDAERKEGRENAHLRDHLQRGNGEKPRRLSIAILGIQPAQADTVTRAYRGRRVDIVTYDSDEASTRTPVQRDVVIMMTKFVSHTVQERWRPVVPKTFPSSFFHCNGGVTELCALINGALSDRGY